MATKHQASSFLEIPLEIEDKIKADFGDDVEFAQKGVDEIGHRRYIAHTRRQGGLTEKYDVFFDARGNITEIVVSTHYEQRGE